MQRALTSTGRVPEGGRGFGEPLVDYRVDVFGEVYGGHRAAARTWRREKTQGITDRGRGGSPHAACTDVGQWGCGVVGGRGTHWWSGWAVWHSVCVMQGACRDLSSRNHSPATVVSPKRQSWSQGTSVAQGQTDTGRCSHQDPTAARGGGQQGSRALSPDRAARGHQWRRQQPGWGTAPRKWQGAPYSRCASVPECSTTHSGAQSAYVCILTMHRQHPTPHTQPPHGARHSAHGDTVPPISHTTALSSRRPRCTPSTAPPWREEPHTEHPARHSHMHREHAALLSPTSAPRAARVQPGDAGTNTTRTLTPPPTQRCLRAAPSPTITRPTQRPGAAQ